MGDDELTAAIRDFVDRIGAFDPPPGGWASTEIEVRSGGGRAAFDLSPGVATALAEALRGYHDRRDRGRCEGCGSGRLDDNLICVDCGRTHGIFGQLLAERAARYGGDPKPLVD